MEKYLYYIPVGKGRSKLVALELGFFELIELGFFEAFWNWGNIYLTIGIYLCVLIGAAVQYLICRKCKRWSSRGALIWFCLIGILASEYSLLFITGWDRLLIHLAYGFDICILLGAVLMLIIQKIRCWKNN